MKIRKNLVIYGILLLVFVMLMLPWLRQGLPFTDDYIHHVSRMWFMHEEVKNFDFSEWNPYMYGGWPFFHFYHPLFYIINIVFIAILAPTAALKAATLLAYLISLTKLF